MHLRKLPSGSWQWIVKVNGATRRGTEPSKAKAKMRGSEAELDLGRIPRAGTATVGDLLEHHLSEHGYAPTLAVDLRRILDKVPEDVKAWRVRDVEPLALTTLYKKLAAEGWKPNTIRRLHMFGSSAFKAAMLLGWLTSNPFRAAATPKVPKSKVNAPSVEQVKAVLDKVDGRALLFLRMSATTGARRGEVCALQWQDIDLTSGTVVVRRSVGHVPGHGLVISDGKTAEKGHRVIGVDAVTVQMLRAEHDRQSALARDHHRPMSMRWVFSDDAGLAPWRGDFMSRKFRHACKAAGVSGVRLHDLRHHVATQMLAAGDPVSVVSKRLGHASPVTTLGVYAHHVPAADRAAADRLGAALN